jgi:hypothetical protein
MQSNIQLGAEVSVMLSGYDHVIHFFDATRWVAFRPFALNMSTGAQAGVYFPTLFANSISSTYP